MTVSDEERRQRIASFLAEESQAEPRWIYLSFVDPDRPEGDRFLGACWVKAGGFTTALQISHARGINPGGEVAFTELSFRSEPPEGSAYKLHCDRYEIDRLCQIWKDQESDQEDHG
jgi:hypothetical protein